MSGRAAALRVARRNAWRNRKRTVFLVSIIALPVALAVVVAGLFRADSSTPEEAARSSMGDADIYVDVSGQPAVLDWLEAELGDISPEAESTLVRSVEVDAAPDIGGIETLSDVDPSDPISGSMKAMTAGRMPGMASEVALSPRLAERLDVAVGGQVDLALSGVGVRTFELVGLIGSPRWYDESLVTVTTDTMDEVFGVAREGRVALLVTDPNAEATAVELAERWHQEQNQFWPKSAVLPKPGELEALPDEIYVYFTADEVAQLVEVAHTNGPDAAQQEAYRLLDSTARPAVEIPYLNVDLRHGFLQGGSGIESPPVVSTAVSALLLLEVAFIAGAAFAAGTRRRLREIGLLGANGASDKHIRLTVLGEGLGVGGLGALAGIALGVTVLVAARPLVQRFVSRLLVGVGVTPLDLLGPAVMAIGAAALAAWIPSRTASRVPTTTALQGRMPAFPPRRWVVPIGFGLAGIGAALMVVALASRSGLATAMAIAGAGMAIGGTALLAGPILAFFSKGADSVPATPRLVLRDSGRHRTRSAVAVAATLVILLIPVVSIAFQATETTRQRVNGLFDAERHLTLMGVAPEEGMVGGARNISQADIDRVAALVPEERVALFEIIADIPLLIGSEVPIADGDVPGIAPGEGEGFGVVAVANAELIATLGHPDLAKGLAQDGMVVLGVESEPIQVEIGGERRTVSQVPMPVVGFAMPRTLVTEDVAAGLEGPRFPQALFVLSRPMTTTEREALFTGELDIVGGWSDFSVADLYPLMLGGTLLVVLIVIALVTAVSAAEVDQDLGIVVAVGAPGSIRRRFLGEMAGYQTLVAAVLAIPLGLGLLKVVGIAQDNYYSGPFGIIRTSFVEVPWPALLAIGIVLPILVAALTALSVRSAPVTPPRRPT
ncbi:MAG: FtsX-like permease family protein [Acidimicrobiia bacterium]